MTHTVCGQPVTWVERQQVLLAHEDFDANFPRLMIPVCETCGTEPPDAELSPGRPWELVDEHAPPETR